MSGLSRRNILTLIGGGTVLAAIGAGGYVANLTPSHAARQPWRDAGQYADSRKRALSYAILAPNPHNMQPWLVRLEGEDALTLYADPERLLPATDPYSRQIVIGYGAFLELLSIAAAQDGLRTVLTSFPDGEDMTALDNRPVAHVRFIPDAAEPDPLFANVLARRSNKEVYEARDVPQDALDKLRTSGGVTGVNVNTVGNTDLANTLRDLTWRAHVREMTTPAALMESVDVMHIGRAEVTRKPYGIELEGRMIQLGRMAGVVNRKTLADPASTAFRQGLEMYREMAHSGRAFGWMTNANKTRADQINAGRAYLRFNLKATELGLGIHPWSQSLQEYPEMADLYNEAHKLIGEGETLQMLVRIGYAPDIMPTPRSGLDTHIV